MRGYVGFMRDALRTLSEVEGRPELEILAQINAPSSDVQYIRTNPSTAPGTTPLIDGAKAFESAKQWVLSGAVLAASGRSMAIQPRRKPSRALDFLRDVRLGLTLPGSYVLSIQIPLQVDAGPIHLELEHPALEGSNIPFQRVVSTRLYQASAAALHAAEVALDSQGDVRNFHEAVESGVSADLCESLTGFSGENGNPFTLGFTWASMFPFDDRGPLSFTGDHSRMLTMAAQMLRETEPEENVRIIGNVVRLHREGRLGPGEVSILGVVDGDINERVHRVWIELDENQYREASAAHAEGSIVTIRGTLLRRGSRAELSEPHDFDVVSTP
ncbi:hypothetical protein [Saccharothrix variisporea]|nr:hypothetical protein [Saccharothrix variisporea]